MARCNGKVGKGLVSWGCIVDVPPGASAHEGPCAANEAQWSLSARARWEEGEEARKTLAETQSQPQTFAQANPSHAASKVPGTGLTVEEHRRQSQPNVGTHGLACTGDYDCPADTHIEGCYSLTKVGTADPSTCEHPLLDLTYAHGKGYTCNECGGNVPVEEVEARSARTFAAGLSDFVKNNSTAGDEPPRQDEPTKQRSGDQRLPVQGNQRPAVQDQIIALMEESKRVGVERYGQPLRPMNGRDTLLDARDEARDLLVYLTGLMAERDEILAIVDGLIMQIGSPDVAAQLRRVAAWLRGTPLTDG